MHEQQCRQGMADDGRHSYISQNARILFPKNLGFGLIRPRLTNYIETLHSQVLYFWAVLPRIGLVMKLYCRLALLLPIALLSGCTEKMQQTLKELAEPIIIKSFAIKDKEVQEPKNKGSVKLETIYAPCTEFPEAKVSGLMQLIFVDANVSEEGDGSSFEAPLKTMYSAMQKIADIRSGENALKLPMAPIHVLVMGGTYSLDNELKGMGKGGAKGESLSIVDFTVKTPEFYQKIIITGGFTKDDKCVEMNRNEQGLSRKATIFDGQGKSLHVVLVDSGNKSITLQNITIKGGKADKEDERKSTDLVPHFIRSQGGALAIRGTADTVNLVDITLKDSKAESLGGCLAIVESAKNITADNLNVEHCTAISGGGGIVIADAVDQVTFENLTVKDSHATAAGSKGGGILVTGGARGITVKGESVVENCSALAAGGGVNIEPTIPKEKQAAGRTIIVPKLDIALKNNRVNGDGSYGGGLAVTGDIAKKLKVIGDVAAAVAKEPNFVFRGAIDGNSAKLLGGGAYVKGAAVTFEDVSVSNNWLTETVAYKDAVGGGMYFENSDGSTIIGSFIKSNSSPISGAGLTLASGVKISWVRGLALRITKLPMEMRPMIVKDKAFYWMPLKLRARLVFGCVMLNSMVAAFGIINRAPLVRVFTHILSMD